MSGSLVATPATAKARAKHRLNTTTTHQEKADEDNSVTHKTPDSTHRLNTTTTKAMTKHLAQRNTAAPRTTFGKRRKERKKQVEDKCE